MMKRKQLHIGLAVFLSLVMTGLWTGCTTDITLDIPEAEQKYVVEGSIEPGAPPFLTLTSTVPFYGEINFNELDNYYVHDAEVVVSDGVNSVTLVEYCLSEIPEELKPLVAEFLGIDLDSTGDFPVDICLYTVPDIFAGAPAFVGEIGKTYTLTINHNGKTLSSSTSLMEPVHMDSLWVEPHDDIENDSLVRLYVRLSEPDPLGDYYRYFTSRNQEGYYPGFTSVFDDKLVNGISFTFTLDRGFNPAEEFNQDTYGYFWKGDTVVLKWCRIDYPTFDFWRTLEYDSGSDGPFSSATIVQTNINGGLGIWCGYGAAYDTLIIAE